MERPDYHNPKTPAIAQTLTQEQHEEMLRLERIGRIPKPSRLEQALLSFAFTVVVVVSFLFA